MKIRIPKDIVGTKFPKICTIEMNNFDIDLFLPSLYFSILAEGRGKAKIASDPTNIQKYINILSESSVLEGFDDVEGRKLLERFVRSTLITTGGVGLAKKEEQITSIVPYSLLAYKPGFPREGSRLRGADTFIYQALRTITETDKNLRNFIIKVFGHGVNIGTLPGLGGSYDGQTGLDTITRLSIEFLGGFDTIKVKMSQEKTVASPCPILVKELANDLYLYLNQYYEHMPTQAFTSHLLILINLELFNYTLKLVHAINELVQNPQILPSVMLDHQNISPPQIYVDFTEAASVHSNEMAKACVRRDVETYQRFLASTLTLRLLDKYVNDLRHDRFYKADIEKILQEESSGGAYLQGLLLLRKDREVGRGIDAQAHFDEKSIRKVNTYEGEQEDANTSNWLDTITDGADGEVERVVSLLAEGQRESAINHFMQWFWGVGGIKKQDGIVRGGANNRKSWRYAPTNNLLAVLVQLAAVRLAETSQSEVQPIRLQDFLRFLEKRFGILVDRPPDQFEGAEYVAAARDNLNAMLNRLRQMGIFRDLSDDFTVQRLYPPYAHKVPQGQRYSK